MLQHLFAKHINSGIDFKRVFSTWYFIFTILYEYKGKQYIEQNLQHEI